MIRILTICTGNICRSPLAAQLFQAGLPTARYEIASAGISVLAGEHSTEEALRVASDLGLSGAADHRAAVLTSEAVAAADLILGMERTHRRKAARSYPAAAKRAFTLLEFAQVASQLGDEQLKRLMEDQPDHTTAALDAAARMRGVVPRLPDSRLYDVEDPYGRSWQIYQRSARQIATAVEQIVDFLDRTTPLRRDLSTVTLQMISPQPALQLSKQK